MSRVLIVNMPFSNLRWPNIGPSLLKAALERRAIHCDVAYLNFDFAERVGIDRYEWIADHFAFVLGGERLFAKHYFEGRLPDDESYYRDVLLHADPGLTEADRRDYQATERHVEPFLDECTQSIDWSRYAVVGFAMSFQQTMASMSLARRIKQAGPEIRIMAGGAACEAEMGIELFAQFPQIDYVFLGEADLTFPPLVEEVLKGNTPKHPPGVVARESGKGRPIHNFPVWEGDSPIFPAGKSGQSPSSGRASSPLSPSGLASPASGPLSLWERAGVRAVKEQSGRPSVDGGCTGGRSPHPNLLPEGEGSPDVAATERLSPPDPGSFIVRDMDALPYPNFDDYFERLHASPLRDRIHSLLFFETSRGCWWGQKHHCKFCGLNGSTLVYRSKSPRRAVDELRHLVGRYDVHQACSSDNILDHRYFHTFLPLLKEANLDLEFVFEMKTNLSRAQVETLMEAGMGAAQLGIETFITPVLRLIGKGANAVQNLQTLKWFSEYDIEVKWNLLYGFPGENPKDYAGLAGLIPSIVHMAPPLAVGRVRLDRFAPYFDAPAAYGMKNARPNRAFRHVYPFPPEALARMAYYFEYDYADGRNPLDYAAPTLEAVETWQGLKGTVTLRWWDRSDGVLILNDTRPSAAAFQRRLTGIDRLLYLYCDTGRSLESVLRFVGQQTDRSPPEESAVQKTLDAWVDGRIMARLDGRYLSLALRARSGDDGNGS